MNYEQALQFLEQFVDFERRQPDEYNTKTFNLERMKEAASCLNHPEQASPSIHVSGTKGKGSVCLIIEQFLFALGLKTGTYISPHLLEVRERIRIDKNAVSRNIFSRGTAELKKQLIDDAEPGEKETHQKLTYFEWLTLLAFHLFEKNNVDLATYEVGMGGRLDSTNILHPELCVITSIGLDHTQHLGDSIEEIAREKAGIIKKETPVVTSAKKGEGLEIIEDVAENQFSETIVLGRDFKIESRTPQSGSGTGQKVVVNLANSDRLSLHMPVPGPHQAENLATAVQAIQILSRNNLLPWNPGVLSSATRQLSLPARFQLLNRRPPVILDAAHNPLSCRSLLQSIEETNLQKPLTLLFAASSDKNWKDMLNILHPAFDRVILTGYNSDRSCDPQSILDWLEKEHPTRANSCRISSSPSRSVRDFIENENRSGSLVVAGSFYLLGDILDDKDLPE